MDPTVWPDRYGDPDVTADEFWGNDDRDFE